MAGRLDIVRVYYDACNRGDAEAVAALFTGDAVHYFTRRQPIRGPEDIGTMTRAAVETLAAEWTIEHGLEQGDEACIEFTMTWRDPASGDARLDRGTEWFTFEGDLISEVRAYHHGSRSNPSGDLLGFDHVGRGRTVLPHDP